ncbi:protein ATAF2-like [Magnolia sinica]|uniref:protein ATAF2-like n=1 Tax=Magnolia sinica TaxID=86752 RepID=UPI002659AEAD|nr:protein ATAF2-like [Magnolia sinica]
MPPVKNSHAASRTSLIIFQHEEKNALKKPSGPGAPSGGIAMTASLTSSIKGLPLPAEIIQEIDIYNFNPDQLSSQFEVEEEKDMYFFTQRNRKYEGGSRPARKAGNGYWKATTGHTTVLDQEKVVGYKMNLKFHVGTAPKGKKTDWLMTEYSIDEVDPPTTTSATEMGNGKRKRKMVAATQEDHHIRMNGFVLCRIYKNRWADKKTNETTNDMQSSTSFWGRLIDEITPEVDRCTWNNNEDFPPLTLSEVDRWLCDDNEDLPPLTLSDFIAN